MTYWLHHITPPPLTILFFGQYYSLFVHVCKAHTSYTIAWCTSSCVSSLPQSLASGCFRYYITKSSSLCIIHNCMLFPHFVIGYHLSNSIWLLYPPAGAPYDNLYSHRCMCISIHSVMSRCNHTLGSPFIPYTSLPISCYWLEPFPSTYGGTQDVQFFILCILIRSVPCVVMYLH